MHFSKQKSLFEQYNEKALSLMGDKRIVLFGYHPCRNGTIVGIDRKTKSLIVVMDDNSQIFLPVSSYMEKYSYGSGIKVELSDAARDTIMIENHRIGQIKNLDIFNDKHHRAIALRISKSYVAWEMIKVSNAVHVLNKSSKEDHLLIEGETPWGQFRYQVTAKDIVCGSLESLCYSPEIALSIADELIENWFANAENIIFEELSRADKNFHYLIGAIDPFYRKSGFIEDYCLYLDDKGNWINDYNKAFAIQIPLVYKLGIDDILVKEQSLIWKDFFTDFFPVNHELIIIPANFLSINKCCFG